MQPHVALFRTQQEAVGKIISDRWATSAEWEFSLSTMWAWPTPPLPVIGWASVLADSAGRRSSWFYWLKAGILRNYLRGRRGSVAEPELPKDRTWERRAASGGTALILMGFVLGLGMPGQICTSTKIADRNSQGFAGPVRERRLAGSVNAYGRLQAEKAVQIAAHSHIIEFGLLAILLSFVRPYVFLTERWKRIWVKVLLAGSVILPVFVAGTETGVARRRHRRWAG
jgi:hypothetical protein